MRTLVRNFMQLTAIALVLLSAVGIQAQNRPYRVSDREVQTVIDKLERDVDAFRTETNRSMGRSSVSTTVITDFEDATDRLKDNFLARRSTAADVQDVLTRGSAVSGFIRGNRVSMRSNDLWTTVRSDLNTLAGYYNISSNWNDNGGSTTTTTGYSATPRQMRDLLARLKQRSLTFRQSYERWSSRFDRPNNPSADYDISRSITQFDLALDNLSRNYRTGGSVDEVLRAATPIDAFISRNQTNAGVRSNWNLVRTDLDSLAGYYSVRWDWNNNAGPGTGIGTGTGTGWGGGRGGRLDEQLTGTYRLNTGLSDNVSTVIDRAIVSANYSTDQRDRARRNLERRLTAPEMLAFDMRGRQLTMAGRNGQTVTVEANGVAQTETSPNGRTISTTVTATNNDLTINYAGDRMNDYYVSFAPVRNGQQLRVTRRIYLENQNETVTAVSVYDKTSQTPDWNGMSYNTTPVGLDVNSFIIPNNTQIIATLDSSLSTRTARDGDRFSMTVTSPSRYQGAIIEGTVSGQRSGVVSGRANMSLNFQTIRMRGDNRSYNFAGIVEQVRNTNGDVLNANNEGVLRDSSQTNKTVTRAGIGAVLGGIIGAIAGGGSGAAIGATVGAGAGAGTVVLQGKDNLELMTGSEFTITATGPANISQPLR